MSPTGSKAHPVAPKAPVLEALEAEVATLYADHAASLQRYGKTLTASDSQVQEAIQEAFLAYFRERLAGREILGSKVWLFRAVRDGLQQNRDAFQTSARSVEGLQHLPDRGRDLESEIHQKEVLARVSASLTPREFECVCLRAEGLSYRVIAEIMHIRPGTVGVVLSRGLKKLRRVL